MLPIPLLLALTAGRELLRALAFPFRALLYLAQRRSWEELCRSVLSEPPDPDATSAIERFAALRPATPNRHVFVSAGEVSGEIHASKLMRATADALPDLRWTCFGGDTMREAGGEVRYPLSGHAIMGVMGVLKSLPFILKALAAYLRMLRDDRPDLVVLVDYPGLHTVMGRWAKRFGVPVLHYIAPQYWAWAPWRLHRYRRCADATLTILPFETNFYERFGLPAEYVGHPLLDHLDENPVDPSQLAEVQSRPTVCLLLGSRRAEIQANLAAYVDIARRLRAQDPTLRFVAPHVSPRRAELIREQLVAAGADDLIECVLGPLEHWLAGSRIVLAKSGTGSLESCLHGTPTVIVYKLPNAFWDWMFRRFLSIPWVGSANLIAGREIVPEHVFADPVHWSEAEASLRALLPDGEARSRMLADLRDLRTTLGEPGASGRAARWIVAFYGR